MGKQFRLTRIGIIGAMIILSGCASVPGDLGRSDVDQLVSARGQPVDVNPDALLTELTRTPLSAESAVRVALINNPDLQSSYARLGFAAADVYEAGRIRNPILSGSFLDSNVSGEGNQNTFGLVASFTDLITLRARSRLARDAYAALKQEIGAEVLATAASAEKAYYYYVGAQQVAALRRQIAKAGALSAALAQRFRDAGNLTPRELAMERAAASEAELEALQAEAEAFAARTELASVLGLSVGDVWQAPAALHLPLEEEDALSALLTLAQEQRLDLAAAMAFADVLADRRGVVNWTRWLGDLDVGVERERETDGARLTGPTVDWEIPIFNQHRDAVLRADTELQIAINDARRVALDVDNSVRLAHATLENARSRVDEFRRTLIPQRIETVSRAQEEVNFMLIGIFELIALKQDEYDTYQAYLEAIRDYWLARADLALAAGTVLPSSAQIGEQRIDVDEFVRPASGGMDHSGHGGGHDHSSMQNEPEAEKPMDHSKHRRAPEKDRQDAPNAPDHDNHEQHNHGGAS